MVRRRISCCCRMVLAVCLGNLAALELSKYVLDRLILASPTLLRQALPSTPSRQRRTAPYCILKIPTSSFCVHVLRRGLLKSYNFGTTILCSRQSLFRGRYLHGDRRGTETLAGICQRSGPTRSRTLPRPAAPNYAVPTGTHQTAIRSGASANCFIGTAPCHLHSRDLGEFCLRTCLTRRLTDFLRRFRQLCNTPVVDDACRSTGRSRGPQILLGACQLSDATRLRALELLGALKVRAVPTATHQGLHASADTKRHWFPCVGIPAFCRTIFVSHLSHRRDGWSVRVKENV